MEKRAKIGWTIFALLAAALALSDTVDNTADTYAAEAFKRALVTFAVARGLNGVISVAQGTEVALEPGGVGVNFSVGQILDPINDLVEQFSSVMLVATTSLGLQNFLLEMTGWWGVTALLVLAVGFLLVSNWLPSMSERARNIAVKMFLVLTFLRFVLPILIIGTQMVFSLFLEQQHDDATAVLQATSSEIEDFNREESSPAEPSENTSLADRLGEMWENSVAAVDVSGRIERLKSVASGASEEIINLIVIFFLQTIAFPIAFLWLFVEGLKAIASRTTRL